MWGRAPTVRRSRHHDPVHELGGLLAGPWSIWIDLGEAWQAANRELLSIYADDDLEFRFVHDPLRDIDAWRWRNAAPELDMRLKVKNPEE
jgi:hypothetical protein